MPSTCRAYLVIFAILASAFLTLHPYLDEAGLCGAGGCPEASQSSSHTAHSTSFTTACLAAVLAASGAAALAFAPFFVSLRAADHRRPVEAYLSLDTPPPQVSPNR